MRQRKQPEIAFVVVFGFALKWFVMCRAIFVVLTLLARYISVCFFFVDEKLVKKPKNACCSPGGKLFALLMPQLTKLLKAVLAQKFLS